MSSVIVVPASALDSMNLGVIGGISALGSAAGESKQGSVPKESDGTTT